MRNTVRSLFTRASGDFLRAWRSAYTDVAYKLIALRSSRPRRHGCCMAAVRTSDRVGDVEIAMFFFTTPVNHHFDSRRIADCRITAVKRRA